MEPIRLEQKIYDIEDLILARVEELVGKPLVDGAAMTRVYLNDAELAKAKSYEDYVAWTGKLTIPVSSRIEPPRFGHNFLVFQTHSDTYIIEQVERRDDNNKSLYTYFPAVAVLQIPRSPVTATYYKFFKDISVLHSDQPKFFFQLDSAVSLAKDSTISLGWPYFSNGDLVVSWNAVDMNTWPQTPDAAYPFIEGGVNGLTEAYLKSHSSVLILLGPPGTGKTQLVKEILRRSKLRDVLYLASSSQFNVDVISALVSSANAMVIEDMPDALMKRTAGNEDLSMLLAISDGLLNGKKIIITSNMSSATDIDPALVRPGRTFKLIETRELTAEEANALARELGRPANYTNKVTLAEFYSNNVDEAKSRKVGFV